MITQTSFLGLPLRTAAQRRLLVVLYYGFLLLLAVYGFTHPNALGYAYVAQTLVLGGLLGGLTTGGPVKEYSEPRVPLTGEDPDGTPIALNLTGTQQPHSWGRFVWSPLDERELGQRDRAHYTAFRILRWGLGLAACLYWSGMAWAPAWLTRNSPLMLWFLVVVTLSLPQSVLLWTEQDEPGGELLALPSAGR